MLKGLVLAGGRSTRMGRDKALIRWQGETQLDRAVRLLRAVTPHVFVSVRGDQAADPGRALHPCLVDAPGVAGPIAGILAAFDADPAAGWLVVACDLPLLDAATLANLVVQRDPSRLATAYASRHDGLPEPLCAVYEPAAAPRLREFVDGGRDCPRKFLLVSGIPLLAQPNPEALDNVNTPEELDAAAARAGGETRELRVQYFALLREQAGRSEERVATRAATARELYAELARRHGFTLPPESLKVAVNAEFADWSRPLAAGDAVVFIPPVAGG